MIINGQNVLQEIDNLIGKTVRILTVPEEEPYGSGYQGVIESIQKRYWDKGHYNVYDIRINLEGFEEINRRHDIHEYEGGKSYLDMDFYDNIINYSICVKYEKHELEFEDDLHTNFFEILNVTPYQVICLKISKYYNKKFIIDGKSYQIRSVNENGTVFFDQILGEIMGGLFIGGMGFNCHYTELADLHSEDIIKGDK